MAIDFGEDGKPMENVFTHSSGFEQGGGSIRPGMGTFVVALDGSGDFDDIQEAIDALPSTGGVVFIKEGTYIISKGIVIGKNDVKIEGTGRATILKAKDAVAADLIFFDENGFDNLIFSDFVIDGNKANQVGARVLTGIRLRFNIDCIIENILMKNMQGAGSYGIYLFSNTSTDGRHIVQKCTFKDFDGADETIFVAMENCIITENTLSAINAIGIKLSTFKNSIVSSNTITGCGEEGILIQTSDENIITGNLLTGNDYGIRIFDEASDKNILIGNICLRNTTGQITDGGTNTHPNGASGTTNLALDDLNIIA